jgi:hypothetical protein
VNETTEETEEAAASVAALQPTIEDSAVEELVEVV